MKRALLPATNPTGIGSAIAAIYAVIVMILNASHHHAAIDPQVIVAAFGAAGFLYARFKVTPIADPKDGNGQPLSAAAAAAVAWTAAGPVLPPISTAAAAVPAATVPPPAPPQAPA